MVLQGGTSFQPFGMLSDRELLHELLDQLSHGHLLLLRRPVQADAVVTLPKPPETALGQDAPGDDSQPAEQKTWLELEFVGEDGKPIPGEPYRVRLPNGKVVEGRLDDNGRAMLRGIDPGTCEVTFQSLDQEAWAPA